MTDHDERWGSGEPESSDSLREFGSIVQSFREHRGYTQDQAAPLIGYSPHTLRSVEQGRRFPPHDFPRRADVALDAFGTIIKAARFLSRNPGLAAWFRIWARMERDAITLCTYECRVIPGLLQTEGYMRAVFANQVPPLSDAQLEARVAARLERQRILKERQETLFSYIIEEAIFHRHTGGKQITRELINGIVALNERRNIDIQVMPLAQERHAGLDGPIQLLENSGGEWYGYWEGQRGGLFVSDQKEVRVLKQRYDTMRSQALTPTDSMGLLTQMRGAL